MLQVGGALEGCSKNLFFAELLCGLENTHDAVMNVHELVVGTPNKREQTRKTFQKLERYAPAMAYRGNLLLRNLLVS